MEGRTITDGTFQTKPSLEKWVSNVARSPVWKYFAKVHESTMAPNFIVFHQKCHTLVLYRSFQVLGTNL